MRLPVWENLIIINTAFIFSAFKTSPQDNNIACSLFALALMATETLGSF